MFARRLRVSSLICVIAILSIFGVRRTTAQQPVWTSPYPLLTTPERTLALIQAATDRLDYIPGEVLIKFKDGVSVIQQERALSALRSRPPASALKWIGDVAVLRDATEDDARLLATRLSLQPEVEYAEPNFLYRHKTIPNDPSFSTRQWNFTTIGIDRAWDINPGARQEIVVAVIDTGITAVSDTFTFPTWDGRAIANIAVPYRTNPDLASSRLVAGRDFVFWEGPTLDMEGHGTHVSSTIGEDTNNQLAEAGIAYNATIMPLKVCMGYWDVQFTASAQGFRGFVPLDVGGCPTSAMAQAIRYAADNGASVINVSLGGPGSSVTLRDALAYATQRGAFVAISMGNGYEDGNEVEYPAGDAPALDGVMSVASVGRSLHRAFYSSTGTHTEIAAPGGDSRDGGVDGMIWQSTIYPDDSDPSTVIAPKFDRYVEEPYEGTSMASPHVAGIAALIASQGVSSPAAIEKLIEATAMDLGSKGKDAEYGYGLIQPRVALRGLGIAR